MSFSFTSLVCFPCFRVQHVVLSGTLFFSITALTPSHLTFSSLNLHFYYFFSRLPPCLAASLFSNNKLLYIFHFHASSTSLSLSITLSSPISLYITLFLHSPFTPCLFHLSLVTVSSYTFSSYLVFLRHICVCSFLFHLHVYLVFSPSFPRYNLVSVFSLCSCLTHELFSFNNSFLFWFPIVLLFFQSSFISSLFSFHVIVSSVFLCLSTVSLLFIFCLICKHVVLLITSHSSFFLPSHSFPLFHFPTTTILLFISSFLYLVHSLISFVNTFCT